MKNSGFTLPEILIVVGILITLAALGIPNLIRARMNANEASAIASVRTLVTAAHNWRAANPSYPTDEAVLAGANPPYIDSVLGSGLKQGYSFSLAGAASSFTVTATPVTVTVTGNRYLFADESGVVRANTGAAADATSPPIE